jgi:hypothetical protein
LSQDNFESTKEDLPTPTENLKTQSKKKVKSKKSILEDRNNLSTKDQIKPCLARPRVSQKTTVQMTTATAKSNLSEAVTSGRTSGETQKGGGNSNPTKAQSSVNKKITRKRLIKQINLSKYLLIKT